MDKIKKIENYLKVLEEIVEEIREHGDTSRDNYFFKLIMQDVIGQLKHFSFIMKIIQKLLICHHFLLT